MPTYAVLGSTGNTGQSLLQILSQSPNNTIHAYCRSKPKLQRLNPAIAASPNLKIFEGRLDNTDVIQDCITNTTAIFLAVAITNNTPGNTIAQDTARIVVQALQNIRTQHKTPPKLPKLIVLSAQAIDDHLSRSIPWFARTLLLKAESYIYSDLLAAEAFLRQHQDWLFVTFVKPGALTHDSQKEHVLSINDAQSPVSFLDLAAGMVEIAQDEGERWDGMNVAVNPTAKDVQIPWGNALLLLRGLIVHFFPWLYAWVG